MARKFPADDPTVDYATIVVRGTRPVVTFTLVTPPTCAVRAVIVQYVCVEQSVPKFAAVYVVRGEVALPISRPCCGWSGDHGTTGRFVTIWLVATVENNSCGRGCWHANVGVVALSRLGWSGAEQGIDSLIKTGFGFASSTCAAIRLVYFTASDVLHVTL